MMPMHAESVTGFMNRAGFREALSDAVRRIKAEYREMPGLGLTLAEAQRLIGLDVPACRLIFGWLVDEGFLRLSRGRFVKG
jgi:hypothetical protein